MLLAAVITLEAQHAGALREATGDDVHGLWFAHWARIAPAVADWLHEGSRARPYTLSPLIGLPRPERRQVEVAAGQRAWFRVTVLEQDLAGRTRDQWLPDLPGEVTIGNVRWRVTGWHGDESGHPLAGAASRRALADRHLLADVPPDGWRIELVTPTAFHGTRAHIPLPMPNMLLGSWLRRWQEGAPVALPEDTVERLQDRLAVSAYHLQTVPLGYRRRTYIGCVGEMTLRALDMAPRERAVVDLLCAYAFWAGTGHHTAQGMGLTLPAPRRARSGAW